MNATRPSWQGERHNNRENKREKGEGALRCTTGGRPEGTPRCSDEPGWAPR